MIEFVEEIKSTNTELMQRAASGAQLPHMFTLCTFRQTAGRGQRGNGWESEPDKNISFTTVLDSSGLPAERLWQLSMLASVSVAEALRTYGLEAEVKWPNDIYVGDLKICGILIENVLQGSRICCSLAGIGVNINQEIFVSNAPNPTSMKLLAGQDFDKKEVLSRILAEMERLWPLVLDGSPALHEHFMQLLYRREGVWRWREVASSVAPMMIAQREDASDFRASIEGVNELGQLLLRREDGTLSTYSFKEIKYIIEAPKELIENL